MEAAQQLYALDSFDANPVVRLVLQQNIVACTVMKCSFIIAVSRKAKLHAMHVSCCVAIFSLSLTLTLEKNKKNLGQETPL